MSFLNDPVVMEALDNLLRNQRSDLNEFLEAASDHMDETPIWGMLVIFGKFVMVYDQLREDGTENEAFQEAASRAAADPLTQALVGSMMAGMANKAVGLK